MSAGVKRKKRSGGIIAEKEIYRGQALREFIHEVPDPIFFLTIFLAAYVSGYMALRDVSGGVSGLMYNRKEYENWENRLKRRGFDGGKG